jgi:RimJ/RimL family protein N-acetyltransferase
LLVRLLNEADTDLYHTLRIRSLQEHPEAFGTSPDEEMSPDQLRANLAKSLPNNPQFGAFLEDKLVAIGSLSRYVRKKTAHRAIITGIYTLPEARGKGAARAILQAALDYAHTMPGLEEVILAVTVGNDNARKLYASLGFQSHYIDRRFLKFNGTFYNIEWMILPIDTTVSY